MKLRRKFKKLGELSNPPDRSPVFMVRFLVALSFAVVPPPLAAHGGGLNTDGCHTNKKTSEYHCHNSATETFDRKEFGFKSYKANTNIGFYTELVCDSVHIDHVVSLKDAHESGANTWPNELKREFANDRENHRPACAKVNMSKSASTPSDFLRKSHDGSGLDFKIKNFCEFINIYYTIKKKYDLSTDNNDLSLLQGCQ